ncbi:MAG: hypothetical protein NZ455_08975 [Bacteroidia bacterium]|nr:hypothetical protein [Bacteroidia bacterium]MDW8346297.1 hypothetical protein [Bacteroidia bacterium]
MPLSSAKHRSVSEVRSSPTRAQRGTRPKIIISRGLLYIIIHRFIPLYLVCYHSILRDLHP